METAPDRSLLAAARAGDEHAFGLLASLHRPGLEFFCLLMLGCPHRAHDAVSEALLRGWQDIRRVAPAASARIWLYRLVTDVCLEDIDETDESPRPGPFDAVRDNDERLP
ncbi:MAG: hypothetical protein JO304_28150 [Solirubrobacterales bacterium]|nr:hypothetical protein [Solirubrobacterales bacterium]